MLMGRPRRSNQWSQLGRNRKKTEKKPDAEKKTDTDDDLEPVTEYLSEGLFKLAPEWKVPALTPAAAKATQAESGQRHDTVDGNSLWPPTPAPVSKVERSLEDYSWGDPANVTRGFCIGQFDG